MSVVRKFKVFLQPCQVLRCHNVIIVLTSFLPLMLLVFIPPLALFNWVMVPTTVYYCLYYLALTITLLTGELRLVMVSLPSSSPALT